MKFDPKKPYGLIVNHPWARYEQGGMLFDWEGNKRSNDEEDNLSSSEEETAAVVAPVNHHDRDFELDSARDFLKNILSAGALTRSVIYSECQANNQNWEKVKTAFAEMDGEKFTRRNVIHWKLKTD